MNDALVKKFTKDDIKEAIMQMAPQKSSRSDGFNADFY